MQATGNAIQNLNQILRDCISNPDVPDSVKKAMMLSRARAMNEFHDTTVSTHIPEMEKFLSGLRALNLPVENQYSQLRELRKLLDEINEQGRAFEEARKNSPDSTLTLEELQNANERTNELMRQIEALWRDIVTLTLTVLAMMAQFTPPNSRELVEAFTGEP